MLFNFNECSLGIEKSYGVYVIDKHSAKDYEELIISILKELNINISKCGGQRDDGISVMSKLYSSVQKQIKDQIPLAQHVVLCTQFNPHNLRCCKKLKKSYFLF